MPLRLCSCTRRITGSTSNSSARDFRQRSSIAVRVSFRSNLSIRESCSSAVRLLAGLGATGIPDWDHCSLLRGRDSEAAGPDRRWRLFEGRIYAGLHSRTSDESPAGGPDPEETVRRRNDLYHESGHPSRHGPWPASPCTSGDNEGDGSYSGG